MDHSTPRPSASAPPPASPAPTKRRPGNPLPSGAAVGGRGGPDDELLIDGQEEVFSRTEVEMGRIEHGAVAGGGGGDAPPADPLDSKAPGGPMRHEKRA